MLKVENGVEWADESLRTYYASRAISRLIEPAQATKLSKFATISTATMWRKATFTDTIQSLLKHAQAFDKDYGVRFVYVCKTDIMEDKVS